MKDFVEILAPAGDWASFRAALQSGADSVYFGVDKLNMRARSTNNFQPDDLDEISALGKKYGIKTYLTLNTILYDEDLPLMKQIVDRVQESGISAIIAADQAVISYAAKAEVPVHISTQANISNIEMVEFYSHFADVMVMARELSLEQVSSIVQSVEERNITGPSGRPVKIELFAHGALCMAISGKCYLSLHTSNSSANRGACKQPCRYAYEVKAETGKELLVDHEYIMSPKDLCTIDFLDDVIQAGISVLKIEGRGRSPEYVKTVTRCYKEASISVIDGSYDEQKIQNWKKQLREVYNRDFWDGYYLGRKLGEWSKRRGSQSTKVKIYTGNVLHYYPEAKVAHIRIKAKKICLNDRILIIGNMTGVVETTVDSVWVNDQSADLARQGEDCTIPVSERVRKGDNVYLWPDRTVKNIETEV